MQINNRKTFNVTLSTISEGLKRKTFWFFFIPFKFSVRKMWLELCYQRVNLSMTALFLVHFIQSNRFNLISRIYHLYSLLFDWNVLVFKFWTQVIYVLFLFYLKFNFIRSFWILELNSHILQTSLNFFFFSINFFFS